MVNLNLALIIFLFGSNAMAFWGDLFRSSQMHQHIEAKCLISAPDIAPTSFRGLLSGPVPASLTSALSVISASNDRQQIKLQNLDCFMDYFREKKIMDEKTHQVFGSRKENTLEMKALRAKMKSQFSTYSDEAQKRAELMATLTHSFVHVSQMSAFSEWDLNKFESYARKEIKEDFDRETKDAMSTLEPYTGVFSNLSNIIPNLSNFRGTR